MGSLPGNNGSASTSQDDLALAHSLSATTDNYSHYSHPHSLSTTIPGSTTSTSKKGLSSIFSSSSTGVSELGSGSSAGAEKAAKAGASGFWRAAVAKLSGEGGVWPGQIPGSNPTGSALLTLYSSNDNTLQHVINVHKLTSTDVRPVDKSLFGRSDVLAIWGHPGAMSLSTHPTLDPIYLSFPSTDAHNTWLVLLRSYTSPEIYGKMIEVGRAQGGLYRMWRQIELVVLQTRGVGLSTPNTSSIGSGGPPTITHAVNGAGGAKEKKSLGNLFGKEKEESSRPGTATSAQTYTTTNTGSTITGSGGSTDHIPLGLTQSHTTGTTASFTSTSASFTSSSQSMTERTESGDSASEGGGNSPVIARGRSGEQTPLAMGTQTPTPAGTGIRSYSTTSLPISETETSHSSHHHPLPIPIPGAANAQQLTSALSASRKREEEKRREKEAREKEKEKEKKEKERKEREREREKEREKEMRRLPSLFAEIILDGEVAGRTTVKKCVPPPPVSRAGASTPIPSGSAGTQSAPGPDWFENFLFADLPSFGNLVVGVWKAPSEGKKEKEKEGDKIKTSALNSSSTYSGLTGNASTVTGLTSHTASSGGSTAVSGRRSMAGPNVFGGAKGTQFLGSVEISVPNFRRGEWVEGWWPVYAHANTLSGATGTENKGPNQNGIGNLGIGMGAMGMGGMSGVGGVAGALVQVGELKLRIKVDEEIILPSKSYKNVLDALEKRNYLDVLSDLEQKLRIDHGMISSHIVSLAVARNRLLKDIVQLAEREVMAIQGSTNTLFRGNTILTKTMELAMAWYGRGFLDASVGPIIRRMIAENVEIEVDPSRLPSNSKRPSTRDSFRPSGNGRPGTKESAMGDDKETLQEQGVRLLEYWCNEFWNQIYLVRMECPVELRRLFGHIRLMVERRFGVSGRQMEVDPDDPTSFLRVNNVSQGADMLPWQAISSFVFLRFIVPAILNPHLFNICQGMPPRGVVRSLTLLAKCTQSLANLNPGAPQKEAYMSGIRATLEKNTVTMIDYLSCVSSLPDQFSPTANSSSFLSGPDKHDRLHVINSLRERLTGAGGSSIPTLYKDAIPLLPYALDVPKHLAILSSAVVRNARTGSTAYGGRTGSAGVGAEETDAWSLSRFSELCFDVEAQALKSVATLAQGAASAGAFGGPRTKRSTSVSSTGGFQQSGSGVQQRPGSSRGVTPTGPKPGGSSGMATTPTQTSPGPWPSQMRRPASARSAIATTQQPSHASNNSPGPSPGGRNVPPESPAREATVTLMPPKKRAMRPSTAPSATSTNSSPSPSDPFFRERTPRNTQPESSPAAASFRYLPPEQSHDPRRNEDVVQPETPISPGHSSYGSHGRQGYPTMHRGESESYIPYHYPSRYQGSAEALRATLAATPSAAPTEKGERRTSAGRFKDFMRRPATSSGSPSVSAPSSATAQRPPWAWEGSSPTGRGEHTAHSSSGEDYPIGSQPRGKRGSSGKGSLGASSGEMYATTSRKKIDRTDTSTSNEKTKKKGLFGWLGKK